MKNARVTLYYRPAHRGGAVGKNAPPPPSPPQLGNYTKIMQCLFLLLFFFLLFLVFCCCCFFLLLLLVFLFFFVCLFSVCCCFFIETEFTPLSQVSYGSHPCVNYLGFSPTLSNVCIRAFYMSCFTLVFR